MKKKVLAALAACLLTVCFAYATGENVKIFQNKIGTSHVQVQVQQLKKTDKGLIEIDGGSTCMPGEYSSYIPRITVTGRDSYVRLHFHATMNENSGVVISSENVYGIGEDWIKKGDWFYCRRILKTGEHADPMEGIHIPDMKNDTGFSGFKVEVTADAVQADNFHPDFASSSPWGNVSVQTSSVNGNVTSRTLKTTKREALVLKDGGRIECSAEDLFSGFADMVPGDTRSDVLTVRNESDQKLTLFFRTETPHSKLLDKTSLKIECAEKLIYEGTLSSPELADAKKITTIDPGNAVAFQYSIKLPEGADNGFQEISDKAVWIFESGQVQKGNGSSEVQTGDDMGSRVAIAAAILLLMVIALIALRKKRGRDENDYEDGR